MKVILLRIGELFLKGENKIYFEKALERDLENKLKNIPHILKKTQGRYIVSNFEAGNIAEVEKQISYVFGLSSYSVAEEVVTSTENIEKEIAKIDLQGKSFKIEVKRADKTFPIHSMDYVKTLGKIVLNNNTNSVVDLYEPEKR